VAKREEISRQNVQPETSNGGWMGRVFGSKADQGESLLSGSAWSYAVSDLEPEAASLQAELAGLQAMERQVARSLSAMKVKKVRICVSYHVYLC
jgi:hypothetical protein